MENIIEIMLVDGYSHMHIFTLTCKLHVRIEQVITLL